MKPKIYVSSTIYDFADLRSSLKYVLEELGYTVLLSEFNDFQKPVDKNSYDGCLDALKQADYFLLLIGQRVGGYVDADKKTSITRMEYQEAYKLAELGKLKLLTFVRKSVWDIREDRKALARALEESHDISKENRQKIQHHPSTFVNDADVTFDFLKEVSKVEEMKRAIQGEGEFPKANWVHAFTTFDEIMAALNTQLNIKNPLQREILVTNLKQELLRNLSALLHKSDGKVSAPGRIHVLAARKRLVGELGGSSSVQGKELKWLGIYLLFSSYVQLESQFLDHALTSGVFLSFKKEEHSFEPSLLQKRLIDLKQCMSRFTKFIKGNLQHGLFGEFMKNGNDEMVSVENEKLLVPFSLADCEEDILNLTKGIIKYLDGDEKALESIQMNPLSPFKKNAEALEKERPTDCEVVAWVRGT